jgi:pimeloyl-ACP methyl ester carboxylesterase
MTPTQFVGIAGHRIAYHRQGAGIPVLLVHGITTYSFLWEDVASQLASSFDVIAVDILGCGESDKPLDVSYSIKHHAELLAEFVKKLGLPRFHFVGHDLGGGMGQIFAVNNPELLLDLTLINTVAHDYWPVQPIIAMRTPIIRQFAIATLDLGTYRLIVKRGVFHKERVTDALMEKFFTPMHTAEGRKGFLHFAKCLDNSNLTEIRDRLASLALPVLIIRGDADVYLGPAIAEFLHDLIPGSLLKHFRESGHFIQIDDSPGITAALMDFFSRRKQ